MTPRRPSLRRVVATASFAAIASLAIAHAVAPASVAHGGVTVGPYELEVAWRVEPAIVGQANAVHVSITVAATEEPVTDVAAGALMVTISPVGHAGTPQALVPASGQASATGAPGTYEASFTPAEAGDYEFHLTGSIRGTPVDATLENSVDAAAAPAEQDLDPLVLVGGAAILILVAGMAFLFLRVRPSQAPPPGR